MKLGHTSLVSFLGGLAVYFGALVGFLVLEQTLSLVWLIPGSLLLVGGFLLGIGLCRELYSSKKRAKYTPIAKRTLPETHDSSYALSLATRSSRLPRRR